MDYASGLRKVTSDVFETLSDNVINRARYASDRGTTFCHLIFPDKQSILPDRVPMAKPICLGEEHLEHSPIMARHVLYPLHLLRGSLKMPVFQKTDTHLTDYGALLVTRMLVECLTGGNHEADFNTIFGLITQTRETVGDLGGRLSPIARSTEQYLVPNWIVKRLHNNLVGGNNGIVDLLFSRDSVYKKRILIFGDSFGRSCVGMLSYFFQEVIFLRTPFFHNEIFDMVKPDYVISQSVERYLEKCEGDRERPSFFMYPYLSNKRADPTPEFANAFSAVLSYPRSNYQHFVDTLWKD